EHSVARNVGVHDRRNAYIFEAPRDVEHGKLRCFRPALDGNLAITRIETHRNAAGKITCHLLDERRIAHRRRPDDDAIDSLLEPALHGRGVAHAAPELHGDTDRFKNAIDGRGVHRLAGKRAVEIHHVKILETLLFERARLRGRITMEYG